MSFDKFYKKGKRIIIKKFQNNSFKIELIVIYVIDNSNFMLKKYYSTKKNGFYYQFIAVIKITYKLSILFDMYF